MKPGPKPDPMRRFTRKQLSEWSDRTFVTFWRARRVLDDLVKLGIISDEERRAAHSVATRPNGSINVSKIARIADALLVEHLDQLSGEPFT